MMAPLMTTMQERKPLMDMSVMQTSNAVAPLMTAMQERCFAY